MLPKRKRLHTEDFSLFKRARFVHTPHFSFRFVRSEGEGRMAVVVSSAISKKAVIRNKLRRRVYESIRTTNPLPARVLLTIIAKKGATGLSFARIQEEVQKGIREIVV